MTTPQKLANLLFNDPALKELAEANDAAGILAAINLKDRERTNEELQTINAIVLAYGEEAAGTAAAVLKTAATQNPLLDAIYLKFCSTGISLADPRAQTMLDILFTGELAALGASIKRLGVWYQSRADQEFGEEATSQHVADALVLFSRRKLELMITRRVNAVFALIADGSVTTWAEVSTALGASETP